MGRQRLHPMEQHTISRIVCVALALWLVLLAPARGGGESLPPGANKMCPVMRDQPTNASRFVDYQGRRIYFCCEKCIAKFRNDPAKFLAVPDAPLANAKPQARSQTLVATSAPPRFASKPWRLFGKLHVVVVHFPIAL